MADPKERLLDRIEEDRAKLQGFFAEFVATPTPNPRGDACAAAARIRRLLDEHGLARRAIDPEPAFPNVAASFDNGRLAPNGHIDVFPAGDEGWSHGGPRSGRAADGAIEAGVKVDVVSGDARMEADFRSPVGCDKETVAGAVDAVLARYPGIGMEKRSDMAPSWRAPHGEMVGVLRDNVEALAGFRPVPVVGLGGADARPWRRRGIGGCVSGPFPTGVGRRDERAPPDDFFRVVKCHALSAFDYLKAA